MIPAPLVTIAIPTYNRARSYLRPCLEGALKQTYADIEILVVDNGSTDDTREVVAGYGDPRVRYHRHPKNIVPNDNFNFCVRQARGAYVQLLLDDEQIDFDFVETCLRAVDFRSDVGLIRTGLRKINARNSVTGETFNRAADTSLSDFFLAWFENRTAIYLCNTLFNRAALLDVGGFGSRHNLFQDVMAQVRVAAKLPRADVASIKASTRVHRGQYTFANNVQAWCEDSLDLLDLMCLSAPDRADVIRERGSRFFAMIGYSRANAVRAPIERARAYAAVYRLFERRYLPPLRMAFSSTAIYRSLRQAKRWCLRRPAWVD